MVDLCVFLEGVGALWAVEDALTAMGANGEGLWGAFTGKVVGR